MRTYVKGSVCQSLHVDQLVIHYFTDHKAVASHAMVSDVIALQIITKDMIVLVFRCNIVFTDKTPDISPNSINSNFIIFIKTILNEILRCLKTLYLFCYK